MTLFAILLAWKKVCVAKTSDDKSLIFFNLWFHSTQISAWNPNCIEWLFLSVNHSHQHYQQVRTKWLNILFNSVRLLWRRGFSSLSKVFFRRKELFLYSTFTFLYLSLCFITIYLVIHFACYWHREKNQVSHKTKQKDLVNFFRIAFQCNHLLFVSATLLYLAGRLRLVAFFWRNLSCYF